MTYIRKDIHKSLLSEAKMAENANCFSWAKLFRECAWLLRKKDRENARLRTALEPFAKSANAFDQLKHFKPEECFVYGGQSRPDGNVGAITVGDLRRARAALEGKP